MPITSTVIFCDDIRFETSGKLMFIGVYPEDLVPGMLPQLLQLSIWARLWGLPSGTHDVRFSVGANGVDQVNAELTIVVPEGKEVSHLTLTGLPIQLNDFGHIDLTLTGFPNGEVVHAILPVVQPKAREPQAALPV